MIVFLSSMVTSEIVAISTNGANDDDKVDIMPALGFWYSAKTVSGFRLGLFYIMTKMWHFVIFQTSEIPLASRQNMDQWPISPTVSICNWIHQRAERDKRIDYCDVTAGLKSPFTGLFLHPFFQASSKEALVFIMNYWPFFRVESSGFH